MIHLHFTAQVEDFFAALPEMLPMLPRHWEELALDKDVIPLDPRWDEYRALYERGKLLLVTLRERGHLVGYCWVIIAPSLHYGSSLHGTIDIFWIDPRHRGRMGGRRLFRAVEAELRRRGVMRWVASSKLHRDCGRLLAAIGMQPFETLYAKMLEH
jgi:GNAT superfamily N-acetyltransferase